MTDLAGLGRELQDTLRLKTNIVAYRRFEKAEELAGIGRAHRLRQLTTFCQLPFLARTMGVTIGVTRDDPLLPRCKRFFGLKEASEADNRAEAAMLATTWFCSAEDGLKQLTESPHIPPGEAIAISPLVKDRFEPEVILVYGNPAQIMMVLCGLEKEKYERFRFYFIGEGACVDSLAECYLNGKPAVSLPCYGERGLGQIADDEIILALPPGELERAISGIKRLAKSSIGLTYPVQFIGGVADVAPVFNRIYPDFTHLFEE